MVTKELADYKRLVKQSERKSRDLERRPEPKQGWKSRWESLRANPESKTGFETVSNAKFLRPREKAATTSISTDELNDLDLFVSRRLRHKKAQKSIYEDNEPAQAPEPRRTKAQINCSVLRSSDIPKTKAWHEPSPVRGRTIIRKDKVYDGELNTSHGDKSFMEISQGGLLQDTRRDITGWNRRETGADSEYLSTLRRQEYEPRRREISGCGREMVSGWDVTEMPGVKSLFPPATRYCSLFPQETPGFGGSAKKSWSPDPLRNKTPDGLSKPALVRTDKDLHADMHCSLDDGGYRPSFHSVNHNTKFAKKKAEPGWPHPLPPAPGVLQTHGEQVPKSISVPPIPTATRASEVHNVKSGQTGLAFEQASIAQCPRAPKAQTSHTAQQTTANGMMWWRESGDRSNPLSRVEAVNTEEDECVRDQGSSRQDRARAVCSLTTPVAGNHGSTGSRTTQDTYRQMERDRACLKQKLTANSTLGRHKSDASFTRKLPATGPNILTGCRETRSAACRDGAKMTTSGVQSRDLGNDVSSQVSREQSSNQVRFDSARSSNGGRDETRRKSIRERFASFVSRRWNHLRQSAKLLNCAAKPLS